MLNFVIAHKPSMTDDEPVFWSNKFGWTDYDQATFFTGEERDQFNLPQDGIWCSDVTAVLSMQ
jgi:hypothetical protein